PWDLPSPLHSRSNPFFLQRTTPEEAAAQAVQHEKAAIRRAKCGLHPCPALPWTARLATIMRPSSSIRPLDAGRRRLLQYLTAGPALLAGAPVVRAVESLTNTPALHIPRSLSLVSTHTGEHVETCY